MFEVGTRVKIAHTVYIHRNLAVGNTGVVVENYTSNPFILIVQMDNKHKDLDGRDWAFLPSELEVVE